jgi:hypothetical protein
MGELQPFNLGQAALGNLNLLMLAEKKTDIIAWEKNLNLLKIDKAPIQW